ncbi:alpha-glucuronidase [Dactylosporangium sp. NPDC005555]|uniref:alpha-glucuronidase n=1 Tax=Dactylosporangium sp. NPDC005555 TaxID=3154889 RepID=UPI0033A85F36
MSPGGFASGGDVTGVHPAWLPPEAMRPIGARTVSVHGDGLDTVRAEVRQACDRHGGAVVAGGADLVLTLSGVDTGPDGFVVSRDGVVTTVAAEDPAGLLYGLFHVARVGEAAFGAPHPPGTHRPAHGRRMLDHWDNVDVHPVMGQVERGYSGGSLFWDGGALRADLTRVTAYARLLAACGVNAVTVNNVNVHATETLLLTDRLADIATIADLLRPYHIRMHLAVNFAAPVADLGTADPLDARVQAWWATATDGVYAAIPDFGGYVVKADSEGQPGPYGYGRDHADGANALAAALAPHGGVVHWRAFVYDHRQDWRDRTTDRARAAYEHFAPLDGRFLGNVIVQVKHGPIDFQVREPVSPLIAAMPATDVAVEVQVTQEYTGQQRHVCYLAPMWSEVLRTIRTAGPVGVSNAGDDPFWTGHPLAQANLYAFGRLAWAPDLDPREVLDEWIGLTFPGTPDVVGETLHAVMDDSWRTYEDYTAPLGVGFMVRPGHHYGPDVDGYEYTPWGTYHFADRDGVGVDRTCATGTGFTGQYPPVLARLYESVHDCPDELLLFFHHVPYGHVLHDGGTVIQHIYDTHFAGADAVAAMRDRWAALPADLVGPAFAARVADLLDEQVRGAAEWRDQITAYFFRKSGVRDAHGRRIP